MSSIKRSLYRFWASVNPPNTNMFLPKETVEWPARGVNNCPEVFSSLQIRVSNKIQQFQNKYKNPYHIQYFQAIRSKSLSHTIFSRNA